MIDHPKPRWALLFDNAAVRAIHKVPSQDRKRILDALDRLAERFPEGADTKKLKGSTGRWRLRVGDWRAIFRPIKAERVIRVLAVDRRDQAYS